MTGNSSLLDELVQAERDATGPPPEVADRMWATIEQRLTHGPPPPELDPLDSLVTELAEPAARVAGRGMLMKIVGGVVLVGLGAGLLALALDREDRPDESGSAEPVAIVESSPAPPVPTPIVEPTPTPIAPEPAVIPEVAPEPPPTPNEQSAPKPIVQKSLAEELALMQAMSTALAEGDSAHVLELVAEHRRDFRQGQFIEERSAAEARALCRRGKPKGTSKAEQFAEQWPRSIHLAAVRTDCDL